MIRVLFVLGLVACDRQAREQAPRVVVSPRPVARASPPSAPTLPAQTLSARVVVAEGDALDVDKCPNVPDDADFDDLDSCPDVVAVHDGPPTDGKAGVAASHDNEELAVDDRPTITAAIEHRPLAGADNAGDRDVDDIPDELDKCPDVPEDVDGFEDIDGCPEVGKI